MYTRLRTHIISEKKIYFTSFEKKHTERRRSEESINLPPQTAYSRDSIIRISRGPLEFKFTYHSIAAVSCTDRGPLKMVLQGVYEND